MLDVALRSGYQLHDLWSNRLVYGSANLLDLLLTVSKAQAYVFNQPVCPARLVFPNLVVIAREVFINVCDVYSSANLVRISCLGYCRHELRYFVSKSSVADTV